MCSTCSRRTGSPTRRSRAGSAKTLGGWAVDWSRCGRRFRARGLFAYRTSWFVLDALLGLGLFAVGWLMLAWSPPVAFVALLVARLNVMWWVHDVCHDAVFADRARARRCAELASILFVGTSVVDYQYIVHRIHHGFTNTIGADQAIDTGPVVWHPLMRGRTRDRFVRHQAWFWFVVVLPLTLPYFIAIGCRDAWARRRYATVVAVIARWGLACWLFADHLVVLIVPSLLAAYVLGLTASLNHFHRPMAAIADWNFARSVTCATQNLTATNRVAAWLLGGLTFHIEHHLFATMPRRNYRVIAPEIRAFCARHQLAYEEVSFARAIVTLWHKLRHPFDNPEPPSRPSMDALHAAHNASQ